jgi:hypothetical protein
MHGSWRFLGPPASQNGVGDQQREAPLLVNLAVNHV